MSQLKDLLKEEHNKTRSRLVEETDRGIDKTTQVVKQESAGIILTLGRMEGRIEGIEGILVQKKTKGPPKARPVSQKGLIKTLRDKWGSKELLGWTTWRVFAKRFGLEVDPPDFAAINEGQMEILMKYAGKGASKRFAKALNDEENQKVRRGPADTKLGIDEWFEVLAQQAQAVQDDAPEASAKKGGKRARKEPVCEALEDAPEATPKKKARAAPKTVLPAAKPKQTGRAKGKATSSKFKQAEEQPDENKEMEEGGEQSAEEEEPREPAKKIAKGRAKALPVKAASTRKAPPPPSEGEGNDQEDAEEEESGSSDKEPPLASGTAQHRCNTKTAPQAKSPAMQHASPPTTPHGSFCKLALGRTSLEITETPPKQVASPTQTTKKAVGERVLAMAKRKT
jgi:hypothetical protein